jgi:hypothetical protein
MVARADTRAGRRRARRRGAGWGVDGVAGEFPGRAATDWGAAEIECKMNHGGHGGHGEMQNGVAIALFCGSSGQCVHESPTSVFGAGWQTGARAELLFFSRVAIGTVTVCHFDRGVSSTDLDRMHALFGRAMNRVLFKLYHYPFDRSSVAAQRESGQFFLYPVSAFWHNYW